MVKSPAQPQEPRSEPRIQINSENAELAAGYLNPARAGESLDFNPRVCGGKCA